MKSFFDNLFGKKQVPPKIQKRNEPVRQIEPQHEADDFYKKGDLIGGEYEVRGTLGKGGFGHVYLVRHCKLEVVYAMKTFRDEFLDDPKARDLFKKEVLLWVNLEDHPFILSAKIVLEISGRLFVFMEYIAPDAQRRVNLADHLVQTVAPLDTKQTLKWAIQFCLGMEHAVAHGIQCHRDIKPANILITQDGTLQIGDFGLSQAAEIAWCQSHSQNGSLVKGSGENSFSLMQSEGKFRSGTPGYIAPEVYRFEGADIRSDIYSFGLVLWQMIAGSRVPPFMVPWRGDMESFLRGIYEQQMTGHAPRMKGPLVLAIDRCLRPNPSERFGGFRELRKVLEPIFLETTGRKFEKPQLGMQTVGFWSNKGISLAALKRYEEALNCYDKALQIDPQSPVVWDNKGNALLNLGRCEEALDCYDKALTIVERIVLTGFSGFAESGVAPHAIWNNKGIALERLGRLQEAVNCYDSALAIDPKNTGTWSNKGNALKGLGQIQEAVGCYDRALVIDSRCLSAWTGKGGAYLELGRHKEAVICYDKALEIHPRDAKIWNLKGIELFRLGLHKEAIDCFNKAIEIDPKFSDAWHFKAAALYKLGRHEEAINCYDQAFVLDPQNLHNLSNKADVLCKLGRYKEAIICCDKALAIDLQFVNAYTNKANAYEKLGEHKGAADCYAKASMINLALGRFEEGLINLGKSLAIDPRNKTAWILKGTALSELGRVEEAIGCCDKALVIDPRDSYTWFAKGSWLDGLGRVEEAIRCCDKALSIDPRNEQALFWKGSRFARSNRHEDAIKLYSEVLAINPRNADYWHNKALSEDILGRRREAVIGYQKYLELASSKDAKEIAFTRQRIQELERAL